MDGGFDQQVAIKLLKRGLDTDEIVRRFRTEQQVLAGLNHPNIARLLDGGSTGDGLPYVVMEHVEGDQIDSFCVANDLSVRERVALLRKVCDAVHYAHQNLIVHRDLKPSNILVTTDGVPKLLDFGIAKLLDGGAEGTATQTSVVVPMTPQYASPEQVRGGIITTATDVYALGLLLYELLAGVQPYKADTLSPTDLERTVCEIVPTRPSSAVRATSRAGTSLRRARELSGDIDRIVLRALAKEPERRYASAEQLSEDLRRYLEDQPIRARSDSLIYRTQKFVRRNALGAGLGSALVLALMAFSVTMAVQRDAIAGQNREISRQSVLIADEGDRAQQVTQFLIDILQVPDPTHGTGATLTVREALDSSVETLRVSMHERPRTRAALLDTVGRVYMNLELFVEAEPLLEEALAIRRAQPGNEDSLVAASLHNLAGLRRRQGRVAEADGLRREAIEIQRAAFPGGHPDLALGLNNLASSLRKQRKLDEAEALAQEALAIQDEHFGDGHMDVARTLNTLATLARYRGERRKSEVLYRRSISIRRTLAGDDDAGLARTLNNLAQLLVDRGVTDEAIRLHEEALAMRQRLYAGDHSDRLTSLNNLAIARTLEGSHDQALALLEEGLAMDVRLSGGDSRHRPVLLKNRALVLARQGRNVECFEQVSAALEAMKGKGTKERAAELESIRAGCLASSGAFLEAEAVLLSSFESLVDGLGGGAWQTRLARQRLVSAYEAAGRSDEAKRYRDLVDE